jgi:hypothetical protein
VDQRRKFDNLALNDFNKLSLIRRLGNSGVLPENPRVGSSILSLGTSKIKGLRISRSPLFFLVADRLRIVAGFTDVIQLRNLSDVLVRKPMVIGVHGDLDGRMPKAGRAYTLHN